MSLYMTLNLYITKMLYYNFMVDNYLAHLIIIHQTKKTTSFIYLL